MGLIDFLILLVVAGACGAIAQSIAGFSRGGCIVALVMGFIGALIGMWLQKMTGMPEVVTIGGFPIIWSIIGGVLFAVVVGMLTRSNRPRL